MKSFSEFLFDTAEFQSSLTKEKNRLSVYRRTVDQIDERLTQAYRDGVDIADLVFGRAEAVDRILCLAWDDVMGNSQEIALVAVGGYGRGELHPASDIDILLLLAENDHDKFKESIEQFLTFMWDMGLEIAHSVRSVEECVTEAERDLTVITNLIEARLLTGPTRLFEEMKQSTAADKIWPSKEFFQAKWAEQIARHNKYYDTAYNLEPNVKEGPGGLRDIQMIQWVTMRHFQDTTIHDLVTHGFLTDSEYQLLIESRNFLWKVRFALHVLTGRREDRLLFDYQRTLAKDFGYEDERPSVNTMAGQHWSRAADGHRLGVELFMKNYYRTVIEIAQLNKMLLQLGQEGIIYADDPEDAHPINRRFLSHKGFIEAKDEEVFKKYPFALLEVFLLLEQHPELKGVRASTIRLIRDHCYLIGDEFRRDIRCRSLFMEIIRQKTGVTHQFRQMNEFGILSAYIPAFSQIAGLMQYDLFHVYTVDQHTLFVLRNIRRFSVPAFKDEFPLCSKLSKLIPKPELLYLAALFHDIAKGRGGDHSTLGAQEARIFCNQHDLSRFDTELVVWLVQNHLLMSSTAQHKDIDDPEIINNFAQKVADTNRLRYLYLLTVADMYGTNPKMWNSWKDSLLTELYKHTMRAFERGLENPLDKRDRIRETQATARKKLITDGVSAHSIDVIWKQTPDEYFLRYKLDEILWHTKNILQFRRVNPSAPLVLVRSVGESGATDVFINTPVHGFLFYRITTALDRLNLNVVEARIVSGASGYTMDTYNVLEHDGEPITNPLRLEEIKTQIIQYLQQELAPKPTVKRHKARQIKHFTIPTDVVFTLDERNRRTIMELTTTDRQGLLSRISKALMDCRVQIQNAKISTMGAQVEDVFFITDRQGNPLSEGEQREELRQALKRELDEDDQPALEGI